MTNKHNRKWAKLQPSFIANSLKDNAALQLTDYLQTSKIVNGLIYSFTVKKLNDKLA